MSIQGGPRARLGHRRRRGARRRRAAAEKPAPPAAGRGCKDGGEASSCGHWCCLLQAGLLAQLVQHGALALGGHALWRGGGQGRQGEAGMPAACRCPPAPRRTQPSVAARQRLRAGSRAMPALAVAHRAPSSGLPSTRRRPALAGSRPAEHPPGAQHPPASWCPPCCSPPWTRWSCSWARAARPRPPRSPGPALQAGAGSRAG